MSLAEIAVGIRLTEAGNRRIIRCSTEAEVGWSLDQMVNTKCGKFLVNNLSIEKTNGRGGTARAEMNGAKCGADRRKEDDIEKDRGS